jgi:prolyl oligopeptidase
MKRAWLLLAIGCGGAGTAGSQYPSVARGNIADDPYRGLEQMESADTAKWVAAENKLTDAALGNAPGKAEIAKRLTELYNHPFISSPMHRGNKYFWHSFDAGHDQATLQMAASIDGDSTTLIDPNEFAKDGSVQLHGMYPSRDGSLVAYALADGGGDWTTWHFRDTSTGKDLPDTLPFTKYYGPAFTNDNAGVYYSRFPAPQKGAELTETDHDCKLYYHRFGTAPADDKVIYERAGKPQTQFAPDVTWDGKYLVVAVGEGEVGDTNKEQIVVFDLSAKDAKPLELVTEYKSEYDFVGAIGSGLYFLTDDGAPNKKIAMVDVGAPATWRDIIPQGEHAIESASIVGGNLIVDSLADAHTAMTIYDPSGTKLRDIEMPGIGASYGVSGRPDETEAFFTYSSFAMPYTTYRLDLTTGKSTPWRAASPGFDITAYETKQIFYQSKDGTKVPMFVTAKKGIVLDGSHPTLLYGYGGFGISSLPRFSELELVWIDHGGVAVTANIRGGGEYGDAWHKAGVMEHLQTKIDDFVAAGEALIANKYTSREHLGIYGYSGGGMLVGSTLVQRPDLFGAAAPIAGVLDLLRFQLFGQGAGWQGDFGHPDKPDEAAWLRKISPVHNVKAGTHYPATYIVTSDHDVRVPPLHSYKFAAAMQAAQAGSAPILLRVDVESGHGGGGLKSQEIAQNTELLLFFAKYLGLSLQ